MRESIWLIARTTVGHRHLRDMPCVIHSVDWAKVSIFTYTMIGRLMA